MATTLDDLIQASLETADIEKSNNTSPTERARIVNEALSEVFDFVVTTWEGYLAATATFALTSTNKITLAEITADGPTFYKELGLTRTDCPEPIYPLPTYSARNDGGRRRYWLQGDVLSMWPAQRDHSGSYVLDYVPSCPILGEDDNMPTELERWRELVEVVAAIKFKTKRAQDTSDLERRQTKLEQGIRVAASSRKKEPRRLRVNRRHDQLPGFYGRWGR